MRPEVVARNNMRDPTCAGTDPAHPGIPMYPNTPSSDRPALAGLRGWHLRQGVRMRLIALDALKRCNATLTPFESIESQPDPDGAEAVVLAVEVPYQAAARRKDRRNSMGWRTDKLQPRLAA